MNNLEKTKEYIQNIHLSQDEKIAMLSQLRTHMNTHPIQVTPSPWYFVFMKNSFAYSTLGLLFMSIATTSIIAEGAIPGDILYPVKVNVNEQVVRAFHVGEISKAEFSIKQTERRLEELSELVETKQDKPEHVEVIFAKIDRHTSEIQFLISESENTSDEKIIALAQKTKDVFIDKINVLETIVLGEESNQDPITVASDITKEVIVTTGNISEEPVQLMTTTLSIEDSQNSEVPVESEAQTKESKNDETQVTEEQVQVEQSTEEAEIKSNARKTVNKKEILERFRKLVE